MILPHRRRRFYDHCLYFGCNCSSAINKIQTIHSGGKPNDASGVVHIQTRLSVFIFLRLEEPMKTHGFGPFKYRVLSLLIVPTLLRSRRRQLQARRASNMLCECDSWPSMRVFLPTHMKNMAGGRFFHETRALADTTPPPPS